MKNLQKIAALGAVLAVGSMASVAGAANVLDTGVPDGLGFPLLLDGNDYAAAEFSLGANQTITGVSGYLNGGFSGMSGDTFTIAIYSNGAGNLPGTQLWSGQATYQQDGWNGLDHLSVSGLAAGNYWVAFEVGYSDFTAGLLLPTNANAGSAPALGYAFSPNGRDYQSMSGISFGAQVSSVPVPAAAWLFGSGVVGLFGLRKRRAAH